MRTTVVILLASLATAVFAQDDAARKAAELEQLRDRIGELRESLERDLARKDHARDELRELEQAVAAQAATLRRIDGRIAAGERRISTLRDERAGYERELEAEHAALVGQLRAAYALGRQERIKLLLNQEDPAAVGRVLVYYDYLNRARVARMDRISDLLDSLATVVAGIAEETAALEEEREREREVLATLERTRERRESVVARIEREIRDGGARLERLEVDEQRLVRLLESLTDLLADVPADLGDNIPFRELRGRLRWPVTGSVSTHSRGVLIAASAGREVAAVGYGRVAWAGWMPHYGNLMVIEHGDGYYSLYGHTQSLLRERVGVRGRNGGAGRRQRWPGIPGALFRIAQGPDAGQCAAVVGE